MRACIVALLALVFGCREPATLLTQLDDARAMAADLRIQFNQSADASNRAVMADTDEASIAFAGESRVATALVEKDLTALAPLLHALALPRESGILEDFRGHFSEYGELDRKVLSLAVENTNLKAQALSFGPARQAADRFRDALAPVASRASPKDQCRAAALVAQAVEAVQEIQVLYGPHIAEHDDAAMTKMEAEMATHEADARSSLKSLERLAPPSAGSSLAAGRAALDELKGITAKLVELSRRNTNVLSLDLALRKKPALAVICDQRLSALERALADEGSKATR
jgi:hypothetical protein